MTTKQEQFIQDLVQFYRNRGVHNAHAKQFVVRLNGKVVNLSELYSMILECGGSFRVNQVNLWDDIYCRLFKTASIGANFAVALRQVYNRYLLQYEKTCSGQNLSTVEQWNEDEDEENLFSNTNQHSHALASQYASRQDLNNVTDPSTGQVHNDSKLYCSLLSGLPNELNFAFNVATILSNCNRFDWANDYKFINVLLESMKSYCCICDQFEEDVAFGRKTVHDDADEFILFKRFIQSSISTIENSSKSSKKDTTTTTTLNGHCDDSADISINNSFSSSSSSSFSSSSSIISPPGRPKKPPIEFTDKRCNCYRQFWSRMCLDETVLARVLDDDDDSSCLDLALVVDFSLPFAFADIPAQLMKKIEQRIELIGGIILNISVTYDQNAGGGGEGANGRGDHNRVAMLPLLKFLLLMVRSTSPSYLNLALDILANIAPSLSNYTPSKLQQKLYAYLLDATLRSVVELATSSAHLHNTTKSFEILARYLGTMSSETNAFIETYFENVKICERITQLLTCQYDIALLLALLEFCLTLSETRPFLLVQSDSKILIRLLVNLLNCEANTYFTTGAFKKVKIIDDRPKNEQQQQIQQVQQVLPNNIIIQNGNILTNKVLTTGVPNHTVIATTSTIVNHNNQQVVLVNKPPALNLAGSTVNTNQNTNIVVTNNQNHVAVNQNVLDNESFAISWLRMTYEDVSGSSFKVADIYAEYLKHCCRNARKNVIAQQSFSFLIKRCFPSANLNAVQGLIEGLAVKGALVANSGGPTTSIIGGTVVSQHPQLMSPILKAHLSTPPKNNAVLAGPGSPLPNDQQQLPQPPANTSTLIKSLLANKLRSNQNTTLVTSPAVAPGSVSKQPIGTSSGGSQPLIIANNNTTVNEAKDLNSISKNSQQPQQQQIVFATSSAAGGTSFAIANPTTTFAQNNFIVQNNIQQQQQPLPQPQVQPGQQIFLVRTILPTQSGQQSGPVRLILPASMIAGQRLSGPTGNMNMSVNMNGQLVMTAGTPNSPAIIQQAPQQQQITTAVQPQQQTVVVQQPQPQPQPQVQLASNQGPTAPNSTSTIANSSPLLNVLLDKGKLPDFPASSATTNVPATARPTPVLNSTSSTPATTSTTIGSIIQQQLTTTSAIPSQMTNQQQSKMYILTTTTQANKPTPTTNCMTNSTAAATGVVVNNTNSVDGKQSLTTPLLNNTNSTPMVNGDVTPKPIANNNTLIKHALEKSSEDVPNAKRLKTSHSEEEATKDNGDTTTAPVVENHVAEKVAVVANGTLVNNSETPTTASAPAIVTNGPVVESTVPASEVVANNLPEKSTMNTPETAPTTQPPPSTQTLPPPDPPTPAPVPPKVEVPPAPLDYDCQWSDCQMKFARPSEVFYHVHKQHIMTDTFPSIHHCMWGGPEGKGPGCLSKRPKLSLLTHLQDFHCNAAILKQELLRKRQLSLMGTTNVLLPQPPAHPGYAQNAAMLAIRRHAANFAQDSGANTGPPPSPLTVSIRLTSALILRNLAQRSHLVKKSLELFEPQLCEISIAEGREESRTVAQCLAVITGVE